MNNRSVDASKGQGLTGHYTDKDNYNTMSCLHITDMSVGTIWHF